MPRTEKQYEEIREERKTQIKNEALKLFAKAGFQNASISMIAKEAKISKGLMYNYFESKEELLKEIMLDGFTTFSKIFDPNKDGILTEDEFDYFIDMTFKILKENMNYWRLYFIVALQPSVMKLLEERFVEIIVPFLNTLVNYYKNKGSEDPGVDARLFGAMMDGVSMNYVIDPENFPLEGIKKRIKELYK
jgi:AcrR family transcriptional regulator